MNTIEFRPEILVAGFAHLIWLLLLSLLMLGISPIYFVSLFSNVGPGVALILITTIFCISFFLGTLFEQIFVVISYYSKAKEKRENNLNSDGLAKAWSAKSFFRSITFAGLGIGLLLLFFDCKFENSKHLLPILIIGFILESSTLIAWLHIKYRIREAK
jgi:hypothetical protein